MTAIPRSFRVDVPQHILDDLHTRLAQTRLPWHEPDGEPWKYGTDLAFMGEIVTFWRDRYNWREWEERLNAFPQFHANVGGLDIHYIKEVGSGPDPLPLILTHGWPGSVAEFLDVIEPLAHPERFGGDIADAFTVIVPSLPGYGFSAAPSRPITTRTIAGLWQELMTDVLGYPRYVAQGGDVGAGVSAWLALDFPESVAALHLNMALLQRDVAESDLSDDERDWKRRSAERQKGETAYQQIQGTKPQTLAYGLTDSPAGLAAWILEKFHGWTIFGQDRQPPFDRGHLITNIMLYWLNGINAANWMYCAFVEGTSSKLAEHEFVDVPTGMLLFPDDLAVPPPDTWLHRSYNLVSRHDAAEGGHFAALQCGPVLINDIRRFFRDFR